MTDRACPESKDAHSWRDAGFSTHSELDRLDAMERVDLSCRIITPFLDR